MGVKSTGDFYEERKKNKEKYININSRTKPIKIGIMGGTFDPIHNGHLISAQTVLENLNLNQIIFIPTGIPPHKINKNVTDAEKRYIMTLLAVSEHPKFYVSSMEIDRPGYTYTKDTLSQIKKMYKENIDIFFIIGTDALYEMAKWKDPQIIFSLCTIVVVNRESKSKHNLYNKIEEMKKKYDAKILMVEIPAIEISSTLIRNKVLQDKSILFYTTNKVVKYIEEHKLYL